MARLPLSRQNISRCVVLFFFLQKLFFVIERFAVRADLHL